MWQPDFAWFNAEWTPIGLSSGFFKVNSTGNVFMSSQITLDVACPFMMSMFPYDEPNCKAKLGMYRENKEHAVLKFRKGQAMQVELETQHSEWVFVNRTGEITEEQKTKNESRAHFEFRLVRRYACYTEMFIICYFLLFVAYVIFWMKVDDARITYASTMVLATFFCTTWAMTYVPPHPRLSWLLEVLIDTTSICSSFSSRLS